MSLLKLLKKEAITRGLISPDQEVNARTAFTLVRDMPYRRASDRLPETIISEWQGTCSGKHYLLHELFEELGLSSEIIACTSVTPVEQDQVIPEYKELYEAANHQFVDVHNYLLVTLPGGDKMIVDATWPLSTRKYGMVVNEDFILGQDQEVATTPVETWIVPPGSDAQAFKDQILNEHFTPAELRFREVVIDAISNRTMDGD